MARPTRRGTRRRPTGLLSAGSLLQSDPASKATDSSTAPGRPVGAGARTLGHTGAMPSLPSYANGDPGAPVDGRLRSLLEATHLQWTSPEERRRTRAFGFRPAVETGVLKREWHGLAVRVSEAGIRAARPGRGELAWVAADRALLVDGAPYTGGRSGLDLVQELLGLISSYERWIEAREGREGRIRRTAEAFPDRRPVNALAETRRLQRLLHAPRARGRGR
jgi:hypothetical protein